MDTDAGSAPTPWTTSSTAMGCPEAAPVGIRQAARQTYRGSQDRAASCRLCAAGAAQSCPVLARGPGFASLEMFKRGNSKYAKPFKDRLAAVSIFGG